eukprot:TRINITY_DN3223_c0_g1_i2.p1 TRINITY_DN3223_c0_g1~~TRINITY_DN3223_c0_g1_i2.p1  ORF type:complete len:779 (+),score=161.74 TRINITY_DN3223_c0_g1_i2:39-2375(+)
MALLSFSSSSLVTVLLFLVASSFAAPIAFEPISVNDPPAEFQRITHPLPIEHIRADLATKPLQTNKFWVNFIVENGTSPVHAHPFVFLQNDFPPYGLTVTHPEMEDVEFGGRVASGAAQYYSNILRAHIGASATEFTTRPFWEIQSFGTLGASLQLRSKKDLVASPSLDIPIVRGMAYCTFIYHQLTPLFYSVAYFTSINGENMTNPIFTGTKFRLSLSNKHTWILYALSGPITLKVTKNEQETGGELQAQAAYEGVIRVTKIPFGNTDAEDTLDKYSTSYPTDAQLMARTTSQKNTAVYSFKWNIVPHDQDILHYAFLHHLDIMDPKNIQLTDIKLRSTTKGMMTAVIGRQWNLVENGMTDIRFLPPRTPDWDKLSQIKHELKADVHMDISPLVESKGNYWAGKGLAKLAMTCLLAHELKEYDLAAFCVDRLEGVFHPFLNGSNQNPFLYDTRWHGVVGQLGLTDPTFDYGSSFYNDHHYHYGYFVHAAAILRYLKPQWGDQFGEWVNTLLRDVANPSSEDPFFPRFRFFDWYSGHSWSKGLFDCHDGKDQESTSEEINFHYGLMLWGKASNRTDLETLGNLMFAMARRSVTKYFLMDDSNEAAPSFYMKNRVNGIFFENKCAYTTWFSSQPEHVHGIQMIPFLPVTELVRYDFFVEQEWELLWHVAPLLKDGWRSVLYCNYAIIEKSPAWDAMLTAPLWDGMSRTWALYWVATRPHPGSVAPPGVVFPNKSDEVKIASYMAFTVVGILVLVLVYAACVLAYKRRRADYQPIPTAEI